MLIDAPARSLLDNFIEDLTNALSFACDAMNSDCEIIPLRSVSINTSPLISSCVLNSRFGENLVVILLKIMRNNHKTNLTLQIWKIESTISQVIKTTEEYRKKS